MASTLERGKGAWLMSIESAKGLSWFVFQRHQVHLEEHRAFSKFHKTLNILGTLPFSLSIRMKIALGGAKGMAFLHNE